LHNGRINSADISQHGFAHMLLPLPDTVPPSPDDVGTYQRLVPRALTFISQHVTNRIPTLVHCHASKDRTGVVLVCYLSIHMRISPVDAIAKLRAVKPSILSAEGYEELALRLANN
jgi:protein-tyrosine phosphatase